MKIFPLFFARFRCLFDPNPVCCSNFKMKNLFTDLTFLRAISLSPNSVISSKFFIKSFHLRNHCAWDFVVFLSKTSYLVKFQDLSLTSALCDVTQRHRSLCIIISSSSSSRCSLCWFSGESGRSTKASGLIHFLPPSPLSRLIRRQRCRRYFVTGPVFEALVFCRRLSNTIEPQEAEGEFIGAAKGGMFLYLRLY